jgi:two-component system LytT family response regulator
MEKIRTILIDDEKSSTEVFALELEMYCPRVEIVAACNSASEGLDKINELKPDLVFLDIEMPWMNGFELLQKLDQVDFEVVFVTAYDEFAIKAFRYSAADYLLKPVNKQELITAVDEVQNRIDRREKSDQIEALFSNLNFLRHNIPKIALPTFDGVEFVKIDDILYCEADGSYAMVHLADGQKILQSKTLKQVSQMLEDCNFLRIHQSYLINLAHLKRYVRGQGGMVVLDDGSELPVSRGQKEGLIKRLGESGQ